MDWSLFTDLYQLTMAQGYLLSGRCDERAVFTMHFRDYPFEGGYAIACGMAQLAQIIDDYSFTEDDIAYLRGLEAPEGGPLFEDEFLDYLRDLKLEIDVDAVLEGTVVFPNEPIVKVTGPIMHCQLIETALLNVVNFQTLIATKAARVCMATQGRPVAEFGLRRAQGLGGIWASRAAIVGGCASTSNLYAGKVFNLPVSGTHAHSWVMSFEDELEAFREYARLFPKNCTLLVDTYDVGQGVKNAIAVALEMKERGDHLSGIRIDSGDLTWLSKQARKMLDDAGLDDVKIVLSNDLDEFTIKSILEEGAPVDAWGVGTKLATAFDQPTLGGIYKLSAVKDKDEDKWSARLKVSESISKTTIPGVLGIRRYFNEDGKIAGDMVYDIDEGVSEEEIIIDPVDSLRKKSLKGLRNVELLEPLARNGKSVGENRFNALEARSRAKEQLDSLDETQLRILNPHTYPVGFEERLHEKRDALVASVRKL